MNYNQTGKLKLVEIISDMAGKLSSKQQYDVINYIKNISKGDEKRDTARRSFKVSVNYSVKDELYSDMLENISTGGAFICSTRLFQIGNSTAIIVSQPKMGKSIRLKGEIVRMTDAGFGIKFTQKLDGMFSHLQDVLEEKSICRKYLQTRAI
jgi:Tfp pilus assembly protein PilZ